MKKGEAIIEGCRSRVYEVWAVINNAPHKTHTFNDLDKAEEYSKKLEFPSRVFPVWEVK